MAILTFADLKESAQVLVREWCNLGVKNEQLLAADAIGQNWVSNWDNWVLPQGFSVGNPPVQITGDPFGFEPLIIVNGVVASPYTHNSSGTFHYTQVGDAKRTKIQFDSGSLPSGGTFATVLASYRRTMFSDQYWSRAIQLAADSVSLRLLQGHVDITAMDDTTSPWSIIVKQAGRHALFDIATFLTGMGRALPDDAVVSSPLGWVIMRDLHVGDMVNTPDGKVAVVLGVFPQGSKPVYKISFSDGTSTECTEDHLWSTRRTGWQNDSYKVRSLKEIMADLNSGGRSKYAIPVCQPLQFFTPVPSLDSYLVGALLGDGSIGRDIRLNNPETEIIEEVCSHLPEGVKSKIVSYGKSCPSILFSKSSRGREKNALYTALQEVGLEDCNTYEKFIPDLYKFAPIYSRIGLLQGLMDTDGYCSKDGHTVDYCTVSKRLAGDVQFLVQSLGGTCRMIIGTSRSVYKSENRTHGSKYTLRISLPSYIVPFRASAHKLKRYKPRTKYPPHRIIRSVELVGEKPSRCIKISSEDGLFMTNDLIVTHNTQMENMVVDLGRAAQTIRDVIDQLDNEISTEIVAKRWTNSPVALRVRRLHNPFRWWE